MIREFRGQGYDDMMLNARTYHELLQLSVPAEFSVKPHAGGL